MKLKAPCKRVGVIVKIMLPSAASSSLKPSDHQRHGFFLLCFIQVTFGTNSRNCPLSIYINIYCSIPGTESAHWLERDKNCFRFFCSFVADGGRVTSFPQAPFWLLWIILLSAVSRNNRKKRPQSPAGHAPFLLSKSTAAFINQTKRPHRVPGKLLWGLDPELFLYNRLW